MKEFPQYLCHKKVRAAQITMIGQKIDSNDNAYAGVLHFGDSMDPISVSVRFVERHNPKVGDFLVVYEDGYHSISPEQTFKDGYTLIGEEPESSFIVRLADEKNELTERLTKLTEFLGTDKFRKLGKRSRDQLYAQHAAMCTYLSILIERFSDLTEGETEGESAT
ncbi:hypothetical protein [Burkholderia phage BCSR129]|nr:hypothetical protein [Burkholderia phage BCSR129]